LQSNHGRLYPEATERGEGGPSIPTKTGKKKVGLRSRGGKENGGGRQRRINHGKKKPRILREERYAKIESLWEGMRKSMSGGAIALRFSEKTDIRRGQKKREGAELSSPAVLACSDRKKEQCIRGKKRLT